MWINVEEKTMSTIALYADKTNKMPGLIQDVKKSVVDYQSELSALKKQSLKINQSICNLSDVISSIQASSQTQEQKIASLEMFQQNSEQFIEETARIDSDVADVINQRKDDFYEEYYYLKPECEKNGWEKFCDGVKAVGEWCKEHWKIIVTVVLVIVAITIIVCTAGAALGPIATILVGVAKGLLMGAITGGIIGGLSSVVSGGSFLDGFEDGAFAGALAGALFGGLGGVGQMLGSSCKVLSFLGDAAKIIPTISKISGVISLGMAGFDLLSLGAGLIFGQDNFLTAFNQNLHSSKLYNAFQIGVSALAVFSGGFTKGMKNPTCFVAGTMILTASGLVAIENIKAGDKVISTNPENFETAEKAVLETYVREDNKLIHLIINGEEIVTTDNHPFYVQGRGFIEAGGLLIGDKLISVSGEDLIIEDYSIETIEKPVSVYNFQVEDFHTYFVSNCTVWVHNDCTPEQLRKNYADGEKAELKQYELELKEHPNTKRQVSIRAYDENGNLSTKRTRIDLLNDKGLIEVKATKTAPFTKNQRELFPLLEKYGGKVVGKKYGTFDLSPQNIFVTREGITRTFLEDLNLFGGI